MRNLAVAGRGRGQGLAAAQKVALDVAADAALEGVDLVGEQLDALLDAAHLAQVLSGRLEWVVSEGAVCRGADTEAWYPPYGDGVRGRSVAERVVEREQAAALCAGCPVQAQCLALSFALDSHGSWGVWGGVSEHDRADLRPVWLQLQRRLADGDEAPRTVA
jgi:WhiB family redox-sensing transcriptional regulator